MSLRKLKWKDAINDTRMIRNNPNKLRERWVQDLQLRTPKTKLKTNEWSISKNKLKGLGEEGDWDNELNEKRCTPKVITHRDKKNESNSHEIKKI